ncbi:MAG: hypothetical protein ACREAS_10360 [Nitrososphaera sp.]
MKTSSRGSSHSGSSNKLHPREVMLIRRLWVWGWSDEQIWKEYRIPIPVILKAKKKIERQAIEEFNNKEMQAFELAKFKERLKFIIDSNDAIAKDPNVSLSDRLKSEAIKLDALAMLQNGIEASISSSDPYSALGKIVEKSSSH